MTHQERQAKKKHPLLYAIGQHGITKWLHNRVWTRKAQKVARSYGRTATRVYTRRAPTVPRAHTTYVIYGNAYFN